MTTGAAHPAGRRVFDGWIVVATVLPVAAVIWPDPGHRGQRPDGDEPVAVVPGEPPPWAGMP